MGMWTLMWRSAVLVASTVTTGLVAGLFYGFSVGVMPGLKNSEDRTFVNSMQEINKSIVNPWFMMAFMGALVLTAVAAVMQWRAGGDRTVLWWIVAALVFYLATFLITSGVNVPMNDDLDKAGDLASITDFAAVRETFEDKWVAWNIARSVTSVLAFGALVWALVLHGRGTPGS